MIRLPSYGLGKEQLGGNVPVMQGSFQKCPLTPAELRVLELMMDGLTYEEIAQALGRATSTIRSQLHNAYRRLGVRTSHQAVLECVRAGWLTWSDDDPETAVLMRIEELLRDLVRAVEAGHEHDQLTSAQRDYLQTLDEHLRARGVLDRRATQTRMSQALDVMLRDAHISAPARRRSRDVIADLGALTDPDAAPLAA